MSRVIVAEDDLFAGKIINLLMRKINQDYVLKETGQQLLDALAKERFKLAIIDYRLPDFNGLEITQIIKQQHPNITVLIQSAHLSDALRKQLLEAGASGIIEKPLDKKILEEVIQKYIK